QEPADPHERRGLHGQAEEDRRGARAGTVRGGDVPSGGRRQEQEEPDRQQPEDRPGQARLRRQRPELPSGLVTLAERSRGPNDVRSTSSLSVGASGGSPSSAAARSARVSDRPARRPLATADTASISWIS